MTDLLEMPVRYSQILEDEFDDIEGGAPILPIILGVIAVGGAYYGMGRTAGERSYYAGLRNPEYQKNKWTYRSVAVAGLGIVGGSIFMTGFENKFYSMI